MHIFYFLCPQLILYTYIYIYITRYQSIDITLNIDFIENGIFPVEIQMKTDFLGNSLRRGGGTPSDCCHTDSNASTTAGGCGPNGASGGGVGGGGGANQMQPQNTPMTHVSFAEDDSSCDSHTRWGKRVNFPFL